MEVDGHVDGHVDGVVYLGTVPTMWCILESFRQCGVFWNRSDNVVYY
jgi:hypothetical protein